MEEKNMALGKEEPETGKNARKTDPQTVRGVVTKKFCRQCGSLMSFSYEKGVWICENGCPQ